MRQQFESKLEEIVYWERIYKGVKTGRAWCDGMRYVVATVVGEGWACLHRAGLACFFFPATAFCFTTYILMHEQFADHGDLLAEWRLHFLPYGIEYKALSSSCRYLYIW